MNTTMKPAAITLASLALAVGSVLWLGPIYLCAQQPTETDAFLAALKYREKLKALTPPVQSQAGTLKPFVQVMLGEYDHILTMGPGAERMSAVKVFDYDRQDAVAREANLAIALNRLEPELRLAKDCLSTYREFGYLDVMKELDRLLSRGLEAAYEARQIPRPPPLPDPLPEKAVPALEIVAVSYARPIVVGERNEFIATVRCNYQLVTGHGKIEARVREGSATLHDDAIKNVSIRPQSTATLTWRFTATAEGDIKISARVVRPER
jgi:hypothetical protein